MLGVLLMLYFGYHAVQGDRGLLALMKRSNDVEEARSRVAALRAEHEAIEHKVARLKPESLDLDLLDERARAILNLSAPDEVVLIERPDAR
ncbi:MAG: septum formation initiator family protein [Alphaproteobacteria bacterium]|nr:septum formation initiator family protein [Alphaproteobacteria bacterium]